ncbi:MAG: hypothetical protein AAF762_14695, partial [Pseudomonadota bacterium]
SEPPRNPVFFPPTGSLAVARFAEHYGFSAADWRRALRAKDWASEAWIYKRGAKGTVWRATLTLGNGKHARELDCVIKVEPLRKVSKKIQSLFKRTKAWRQWRGAELLQRTDIACTPPFAILKGDGVEAFIGGWIEGPTVLERLADPGLTGEEERLLVEQVAQSVVALRHTRPMLSNWDHKPSNLVCTDEGVAIIDTLEIEREARSDRTLRLDDHGLEITLESVFREPYGCGLIPRRGVLMHFLRSACRAARVPRSERSELCKGLWRELAQGLGAPDMFTPKDNPLAPPVRLIDAEPEGGTGVPPM